MELFHERLRGEIDRLGISLADAGRAIGDPAAQGLRDVVSGRKRLTAETLARLMSVGVDAGYVLTGRREGDEAIADTAPRYRPRDPLCDQLRSLSPRQRQVIEDLLDLFANVQSQSQTQSQ